MEWWDGIVETGGEILGGAVDLVGEYSDKWLGTKLGMDAEKSDSSNPDSQRKNQNTAEDNNGDALPVNGMRPLSIDPLWLLVGAAMVSGAVYLAMRGK